jgi:Mrp family chromosome partitioning ATPase
MDNVAADEVSVVRTLTRYWWLFGLILVGALALAVLVDRSRPVEYEATAGVIVEDPRASALFEITDFGRPSTQNSERNLADQVEILRSSEIAAAAGTNLGGRFELQYILRNRTIAGDLNSNLIEVSFTAPTPEDAQAGANAIALAYQELRRSQVEEAAAVALASVEALIQALDTDIAEIDLEVEAARAGDETLQELKRQIDAAEVRLNSLRVRRDSLPIDGDQRAATNAQIAELLADFSTWEVVLRLSERDVDVADLLAAKDTALAERATLVARANSIEVNAELAAGGVTLFDEALLPEDPSGLPFLALLVVAAALGLMVAAIVAYALALRGSMVARRRTPAEILDAPLLAEVPNFELESISGPTPMLTNATSVSAEAFRFAASVIEIRGAAAEATSLIVVSAANSAGRTATVANTGLAAAEEGLRVLLIDADFVTQDLSRMLVGDVAHRGLTEVIDGASSIEQAAHLIPVGGNRNRHLSLLSRGLKRVEPASYLRSGRAKGFFRLTVKEFDLVLVDGPSLLQVAYGSALARHTDAAVVVVEHGTPANALRELREHLTLMEIPILGYIETKVPTYHGVAVTDASAAAPAVATDPMDTPLGEADGPEPQQEADDLVASDDEVESEIPDESATPDEADAPAEADGRIVEFEVSGEIEVPIAPEDSPESAVSAGADDQSDSDAEAGAPDDDSPEAADPWDKEADPVAAANPTPPRKRRRQSGRR